MSRTSPTSKSLPRRCVLYPSTPERHRCEREIERDFVAHLAFVARLLLETPDPVADYHLLPSLRVVLEPEDVLAEGRVPTIDDG